MLSEASGSIRSSLARWKPLDLSSSAQVLPLGIAALDAALPGGGLTLGGVTELQVRGASGIATSFALAACRAAQQLGGQQLGGQQLGGQQLGGEKNAGSAQRSVQRGSQQENRLWCAFIDPGASLFAPGVRRLGVDLSRLLVARPSLDAIDRVAVRIAEANSMAVLVVDLRSAGSSSLLANSRQSHLAQSHLAQSHLAQSHLTQSHLTQSHLTQSHLTQSSLLNEHSWQRTVRRLSLAIKSSFSSVLLITQADQFRSLPLPTAQRLELTRRSQTSFELKVAKERTGRISPPRLLPCSLFDVGHFDPSAVAVRSSSGEDAWGGDVLRSSAVSNDALSCAPLGIDASSSRVIERKVS